MVLSFWIDQEWQAMEELQLAGLCPQPIICSIGVVVDCCVLDLLQATTSLVWG
jgi:hypothetical protein